MINADNITNEKSRGPLSNRSLSYGLTAQAIPDPQVVTIFKEWTRLTSDDYGRITGHSLHGLYCADTLLISRHRLRINGKPVSHRLSAQVSPSQWAMMGVLKKSGQSGNLPPGILPRGSVDVSVLRKIDKGMTETVHITNESSDTPRTIDLEIELVAPIIDTEASEEMKKDRREPNKGVRPEVSYGEKRSLRLIFKKSFGKRSKTPKKEIRHLYLRNVPRNGQNIERGFVLTCRQTGGKDPVSFSCDCGKKTLIKAKTKLSPGKSIGIDLYYDLRIDQFQLPAPRKIRDWSLPSLDQSEGSVKTTFETNKSALNLVFSEATTGIESLKLPVFGQHRKSLESVSAGIPRYIGLFGRDTLISGWQSVIYDHSLLKSVLARIGALQGTKFDPWRDEEVGRLPHEKRMNAKSMTGEMNRALYFGDDTSTPFFCIALATYYAWSGDHAFVEKQSARLRRCTDWILKKIDQGNGFIYYQPSLPPEKGSNRNQAWKDSGDAIVDKDGRIVVPPLALIEIQGYAYRALLDAAWLLEENGASRVYIKKLRSTAKKLKDDFNKYFWDEKRGVYVIALNHGGEPVKSKASNVGHCLTTGILKRDRVSQVAKFLMGKDMFSGWGIRTLSADNPAFDPYSYHRGSVWPVENAEIAEGFSVEGFHKPAHEIMSAQLALAEFFPFFRLPEALSGHEKCKTYPIPGLYPYANLLQAWSITAIFQFIQSAAGIFPESTEKTLYLHPNLPEWLEYLTIRNIRFGFGRISLKFFRDGKGNTRVRVLDKAGRFKMRRGLPKRYMNYRRE